MSSESPRESLRQAVRDVVQSVYDATLRERLPRKLSLRNGVAVRDGYLFDGIVVEHDYEQACVDALEEHLLDGDRVVIVGGGVGVTAVRAARRAAEVVVFEAAAERVEQIEETASINGVADTIRVHHYVVGRAVDVWGTPGQSILPEALPECDYLEVDAEGAELDILSRLEIRPRTIVVEAHPGMGVEVSDVEEVLDARGYAVVGREVEVPGEAVVLTSQLQ